MARDPRTASLLRLLAGAAWADGEVTPAESSVITRLAADLGLDETAMVELRALLENPVGREEAERTARELFAGLSPEERTVWMARVEEVVSSDARVGAEEVRLLTALREAIEAAEGPPTLLARVRGLLRPVRPAAAAGSGATEAARPAGVLGTLLGRLGGRAEAADPARRDHAVLFGAILARVAYADGGFDAAEAARLRALLVDVYGFSPLEADEAARVIESRAAEDLDRQRLCASFNRVTELEGRLRLLGCLFLLAEADGRLDPREMEEMRLIANYLWIDARDFHRIRLERGPGGAGTGTGEDGSAS